MNGLPIRVTSVDTIPDMERDLIKVVIVGYLEAYNGVRFDYEQVMALVHDKGGSATLTPGFPVEMFLKKDEVLPEALPHHPEAGSW